MKIQIGFLYLPEHSLNIEWIEKALLSGRFSFYNPCSRFMRAETWVIIAKYGCSKESFLKSILVLENGFPWDDTFN